jgi:hypothetical protein
VIGGGTESPSNSTSDQNESPCDSAFFIILGKKVGLVAGIDVGVGIH